MCQTSMASSLQVSCALSLSNSQSSGLQCFFCKRSASFPSYADSGLYNLGGTCDSFTKGGRQKVLKPVAGAQDVHYTEKLDQGRKIKAFVEHCDSVVRGADDGPLQGLTFATKDMFHVAGYATGFGNPTWLRSHPLPTTTATAVQLLLEAGATLVGKTQMDELAFSLAGENAHYGTPINSAAPDRIPGGSSSGSASAVAAGLVDFALGSDTSGSVRVPASHCGLLGCRPSHGRIPMEGALPLQPTLDTVGWFARDPWIFHDVGHVLLAGSRELRKKHRRITRWLVAVDAFESLADEATTLAIYEAIAPIRERLQKRLRGPESLRVGSVHGGYGEWMRHMRILQLKEVWECDGEWIQREKPEFGPGVRERFEAAASQIDPADVERASEVRKGVTKHMRGLLEEGAVLFVPSAPGIAPLLNTPAAEMDEFRHKALCLTAIAGPAGLPQVSLPVAEVEGCPVGLGLIGPRGWDEELLDLAVEIMAVLEIHRASVH